MKNWVIIGLHENQQCFLPLDAGFGNKNVFDRWNVSGSVKAMRSSVCFHSFLWAFAFAGGKHVHVSLLFQKE